MFIGHFATAYAAKKLAPRTSLGLLFAASQLPDLIWPVLLAAGVEKASVAPGDTAFTPLRFDSYPISHSLLTVVVFAAALAAGHGWRRRRTGAALLLGALAVGHWVLDFASHRPDMPLWPGGPRVGLGLWNSIPWTIAVELTLFAIGLGLAVSATRARDGIGRWGYLGLALLLLLIYAGNAAGSPPPDLAAVAWVGIVGGPLLIALAAWVDHHRDPVAGSPDTATSRPR